MNGGFTYNPAIYINNFKSLRKSCLWAGSLGLIQSLIWIGLTLCGILSYSCVIITGGTFNYGSLFRVVLQQLYFLGQCNNAIPAYDNSMLYEVKTVLSPEIIVIWESVYLAVAVCWLLASIVLMKYLKKDQSRMACGILWTWILVTLCICAMDLALGIIFGIDYGRFSLKAYNYNLSSMYAGAIEADAAQLLAGMAASMVLLLISLKGFVLWLLNFGFVIYLARWAVSIGQDKNAGSNFFMTRHASDDILTTRPPINAYGEEEQKVSALSTAVANGGFEPDNSVVENAAVINREIIARAARLSMDVALQERRFHNLDKFQQYPPRSRPESIMPEQSHQQQTSPIVVAAFPVPDYTPPMQRASQNPNRIQRF